MASDEVEGESSLPGVVVAGWVFTCFWVCASVAYVCATWTDFRKLPPNELGDFLAGVAAPLAFLWLVVATFLQKSELALQRIELKESRLAQQKQAEETAALVEQTKMSAETAAKAFTEQQVREAETRLHSLISLLAVTIANISDDLFSLPKAPEGGSGLCCSAISEAYETRPKFLQRRSRT